VQVQITPILTGDPAAAAVAVGPPPVDPLLEAPLPEELLDEQAAMMNVAAMTARPRTTGPTLGLPEVAFIIPVLSS
jgi:hypothetical protein